MANRPCIDFQPVFGATPSASTYHAINDTRYAVCTILQWDYKSSQNSVTLTVEAPKTDVTASTSDENATVTQNGESTTATIPPPKTPEQMQQEVEQRSSSQRTRGSDNYF